VTIRPATTADAASVSAILLEAARWLAETGQQMWKDNELLPERTAEDVQAGRFWVAECDGEIAGVVKFQLEDKLFWPDVSQTDCAYVHRLAVKRKFAGGQVSAALLNWAVDRARSLGKKFLRLDCEASRARLRQIYERFGFRFHSDRQVGPYFVARYEFIIEPE